MKGETQLRNLANKLKKEGIDRKLWLEKPEDFLTCIITTRPYPKSQKTETALYVKKSHNRTIQVNPRRPRGASAVGCVPISLQKPQLQEQNHPLATLSPTQPEEQLWELHQRLQ
ncbi:unnamed protein product, partial [Musa acuminata var. zebrina]